jgi:hypothetical protein
MLAIFRSAMPLSGNEMAEAIKDFTNPKGRTRRDGDE